MDKPDVNRKSWFGRNWVWVVPVVVVTPVLTCVGLATLLGVLLFGLLKGSEPYRDALEAARQSPALRSELGTPIEAGFMVGGSIELENDAGTADLTFPVSGPNGSAEVAVAGDKAGGVWTYRRMTAAVEATGQTIDLR
jgi:hypothetical protein